MQSQEKSGSRAWLHAASAAYFMAALFAGLNAYAQTSPMTTPPEDFVRSQLPTAKKAPSAQPEEKQRIDAVTSCSASVEKNANGRPDPAAIEACVKAKGFVLPKIDVAREDAINACLASLNKGANNVPDQIAMEKCMKEKGFTTPRATGKEAQLAAARACTASLEGSSKGPPDLTAIDGCMKAKGFALPKRNAALEAATIACIELVAKENRGKPNPAAVKAAVDKCKKEKGF